MPEPPIDAENGVHEASSSPQPVGDRYERGWRKLQAIDGDAGPRVIESLKSIAPDLARYILEFPFGDIYSRPGLDLKSREIATIAAFPFFAWESRWPVAAD